MYLCIKVNDYGDDLMEAFYHKQYNVVKMEKVLCLEVFHHLKKQHTIKSCL